MNRQQFISRLRYALEGSEEDVRMKIATLHSEVSENELFTAGGEDEERETSQTGDTASVASQATDAGDGGVCQAGDRVDGS